MPQCPMGSTAIKISMAAFGDECERIEVYSTYEGSAAG